MWITDLLILIFTNVGYGSIAFDIYKVMPSMVTFSIKRYFKLRLLKNQEDYIIIFICYAFQCFFMLFMLFYASFHLL